MDAITKAKATVAHLERKLFKKARRANPSAFRHVVDRLTLRSMIRSGTQRVGYLLGFKG